MSGFRSLGMRHIGGRFLTGSGTFLMFGLLFAFAVAGWAQKLGLESISDTPANYRLGPGDVLKVLVLKQQILSQDSIRIDNEGSIRMPMLEEPIRAACLTEPELASIITERYKRYILDPQVFVAVTEYNSNPVAVVGAVNAPGRFQMRRPMRLMELLTYVNGPAPNAGKEVLIVRGVDSYRCRGSQFESVAAGSPDGLHQEMISLDLTDVMKGGDDANPVLQAGDIVRVTEAELKQAFVIGNVKSATTINLKEPVTLSRALAMAGGVAPGAQTEKIKVSRQLPGSFAKSEVIVNLKELNKGTQEDVVLQPNDIVDVPGPAGARKVLKDIFRAAIPVITRTPVLIP